MIEKKFKSAFIAHVPDSNSSRDRCTLKTPSYELTSVLVRDDEEALKVCTELVNKGEIKSFLLCPGFTHASIAKIMEIAGKGGSVSVARGDPPSTMAAQTMMSEAGWFRKPK